MPELPEVETIAKKLKAVVVGRKIEEIQIFTPKTFQGDAQLLLSQEIVDVSRRAKIIEMVFANDYVLLTHLKMTGQYLFQNDGDLIAGGHPTNDWQEQLPGKHTRVQINFEDKSKLFFNDMRKFGWLRLVSAGSLETVYSALGPDIISPEVTTEYLLSQFKRRKMPIKQAIMLNEIVCGVGNIYACDSLNLAKISPFRPAQSLSREEVEILLSAMKVIIIKAIEHGGTTFDGKYVDIEGKVGSYQTKVLTYGREGKNCYNCGGTIQKTKLGGRGTYFCPDCQI